MSNEIASYKTQYTSMAGNQINLNIALARRALNIDNKVNDMDVYAFLKLCEHQRLDPFLGEAHLIFVSGRIQKVVGIDTFTNRLNDHPLCQGWSAGLILEDNGKIIEKQGTFYLEHQKIVGAWFKVKRKGWEDEFYWSITYKEYYREYYDKEAKCYKAMGQWGNMPGNMIVKCAVSNGCRKAFPQAFTGLYSHEEFGQNSEEVGNENVIEPEYEEIINEDQLKTIYDAAKSKNKEIKIDAEKLINYVIKQMISQKLFSANTTIKNLGVNKLDKVLEWVKKSVELKEKKFEDEKKNKKEDTKKNENADKKENKDEMSLISPSGLPVEDIKTAKPANTKKSEGKK